MAISSKNNTIIDSSIKQPSEITLTNAGSLIGAYYTKDKDSGHVANSFPFSKETVTETSSSVYRVHAPNVFYEKNPDYFLSNKTAEFYSVNQSTGMSYAYLLGQMVEPCDRSKTLLLAGDHVKGISLLSTDIGSAECSGVLATISNSDWTADTSYSYAVQYNFGYKPLSTGHTGALNKMGFPNTYALNAATASWQAILDGQGNKIYNTSVSSVVPRIIELMGASTGLQPPKVISYEWEWAEDGYTDVSASERRFDINITASFGIKNTNSKTLYLHYWIYDSSSAGYVEKSVSLASNDICFTANSYIGRVSAVASSHKEVAQAYMAGDANYSNGVIQFPMYFSTSANSYSGETSQCIIIDYDEQNNYSSLWGDSRYDATGSSGVILVPMFNLSDIAENGIITIDCLGSGTTCSSYTSLE